MNVVSHCAVGEIALPRTGHCHAAGGVGTLIVCFGKLPAKPASHVDDEVPLGFEVLILRTKAQSESVIIWQLATTSIDHSHMTPHL